MKKQYITPNMDIAKFTVDDIMNTSGEGNFMDFSQGLDIQ